MLPVEKSDILEKRIGGIFLNYIGSKHSLLPFLEECIGKVCGESLEGKIFADIFAGTGVVAAAYKQKGCQVIAGDNQYYSYVLNRHYMENYPEMDESFAPILQALPGVEGFIYQNYCAGSGSGRSYFSDENGKKCDAIRQALNRYRADGTMDEGTYFYYLASLLDSMDRCANTASVYGAFLKKMKKTAEKPLQLQLLPVIGGGRNCRAVCADGIRLLDQIAGDILYLDPPYNTRQYGSNYHVLETIARYDAPELSGKTGLRPYQKSVFCSRRTVEEAFSQLMEKAQFRYIFLSYNNEGLLPLETIEEIMKSYGEYQVFTVPYRRFKADSSRNRTHKADMTLEYLHCLKKKDC